MRFEHWSDKDKGQAFFIFSLFVPMLLRTKLVVNYLYLNQWVCLWQTRHLLQLSLETEQTQNTWFGIQKWWHKIWSLFPGLINQWQNRDSPSEYCPRSKTANDWKLFDLLYYWAGWSLSEESNHCSAHHPHQVSPTHCWCSTCRSPLGGLLLLLVVVSTVA